MADGTTHSVTGMGQGTYNTIAGSLGLASFLGFGQEGGLFGGMRGGCSQYATKDNLQMSIDLARKDSEIALLRAGQDTDKKLVDVFKAAADRDVAFRDRLESQYRDLDRKITEEREARMAAEGAQSVLNAQLQTGVSVLNDQVKTMQGILADITTSVIPARKVCDTSCCGCGN